MPKFKLFSKKKSHWSKNSQGPVGNLMINFETMSREERQSFLNVLPNLQVSGLSLIHCDVIETRCCSETDYLPLIFGQLIKNQHIDVLELGEEFIRERVIRHDYYRNSEYTHKASLKLEYLCDMASLKTLKITFPREFPEYNELERYLSDPACQLEILEVEHGVTEGIAEHIKKALEGAHSLKTYRGPWEDEFQAILDKKHAENTLPEIAVAM